MVKREVLFVDGEGGAWPWHRQMPRRDGVWGKTHYNFSTSSSHVPDWLVVFSSWPEIPLFTAIPKHRRIFVAGEPASFHRYQPRFLDQFGTVITTQKGTRHPGAIHSQPGINWFVGVLLQGSGSRLTPVLNFADFESGNPRKSKLCSVVCSTNATTRGHRQRIEFVDLLKQRFGDQIDFFGRGRRDIADKDDALAAYRFHIALENSAHRDYWTEKLADPFLRGCYPIYSGCPNLEDYFPKNSFARIDLRYPREALAIVATAIESDRDQTFAIELAEAKRRVLFEHNIFALLEKLYIQLEQTSVREALPLGESPQRLYSDHETKDFKLSRRVRRWFHSRVGASGH